MNTVIQELRIDGTPAPKGSKNQFGAESSKRVKPWMSDVAKAVGDALGTDRAVLRGPVRIEVTFAFVRPKSHYRTGKNAGVLRDDAPFWHCNPGDTDKLQRAIGDALTGIAYADDKQIASWSADKIWDERAYAILTIVDLSGGSDDTERPVSLGEGHDPDASDRVAHPGAPGEA